MKLAELECLEQSKTEQSYDILLNAKYLLSDDLMTRFNAVLLVPLDSNSILDYRLEMKSDALIFYRDRGQGFRKVEYTQLTSDQQSLVKQFKKTSESKTFIQSIDVEMLLSVFDTISKYERNIVHQIQKESLLVS